MSKKLDIDSIGNETEIDYNLYNSLDSSDQVLYLEQIYKNIMIKKLDEAKSEIYGKYGSRVVSKIPQDITTSSRDRVYADLEETRATMRTTISNNLGISPEELPKSRSYEDIIKGVVKGEYKGLHKKRVF